MAVIRQGTTPLCGCTVPCTETDVARLIISFRQNGTMIFDKTENDVIWAGDRVTFRLSQTETLRFAQGDKTGRNAGEVQVKLKLTDGTVIASQIVKFDVEEAINREVL